MIGEDSVTIAVTAGAVFDTLVDGEQNVHWRANVVACTRIAGDGGPGTEWQMARRTLGRTQPRDYVVEEYSYPTVLGIRYTTGHLRGTATYTLTEHDGVTDVALRLVAHGARPFRLIGASVPREIGTDLDDLRRLRAYLETRGQEAASPA